MSGRRARCLGSRAGARARALVGVTAALVVAAAARAPVGVVVARALADAVARDLAGAAGARALAGTAARRFLLEASDGDFTEDKSRIRSRPAPPAPAARRRHCAKLAMLV